MKDGGKKMDRHLEAISYKEEKMKYRGYTGS